MSAKIFVCLYQKSICYVWKFFLVCPEKYFGEPKLPPARQQFWGEILMFSQFACSGKLYCALPNKITAQAYPLCWHHLSSLVYIYINLRLEIDNWPVWPLYSSVAPILFQAGERGISPALGRHLTAIRQRLCVTQCV